MEFKPDVLTERAGESLNWRIGYALAVAEECYANYAADLVVTSLLDGTHTPTSLHPKGLAADLRVLNVDSLDTRLKIFNAIHERLETAGLGFEVVWEVPGQPGSSDFTTAAHIHLQWKPKDPSQMVAKTLA